MTDTIAAGKPFFSHEGECPVCEKAVTFTATGPNYRSTLRCNNCNTAPRNRALMLAIRTYYPGWKYLKIHESSPGWDRVSQRFAQECDGYVASQYDRNVPFGKTINAPTLPCKTYRSENLESQTFGDEQFDLVVMQDVFEHIFHPNLAIAEIARTLKVGGALIMTVPIVMGTKQSRRRAFIRNEIVQHVYPPEYHGNPLGNDGSLVTIDWGYDIVSYLAHYSGLNFLLCKVDNVDMGIIGTLNEVVVGLKSSLPNL
jgi:SAM-dependent methyltransferase